MVIEFLALKNWEMKVFKIKENSFLELIEFRKNVSK
jgi:hypothetical protein